MHRFFYGFIFLLCVTQLTRGVTVITNIERPHSAFTHVSWNVWVAQAIEATNAGPGLLIASVSIPVVVYDPNINLVVRVVGSLPTNQNVPNMEDIRVALAASPSSLVDNPTQVANTTAQLLVFTPKLGESSSPLLPGNRYWLIMGITAPDYDQTNPAGRYGWSYTNTNVPTAGPSDQAAILNIGAESGTSGTNWVVLNQSPLRVSATLVPVPEPRVSFLLLLASGLFYRRSRSIH